MSSIVVARSDRQMVRLGRRDPAVLLCGEGIEQSLGHPGQNSLVPGCLTFPMVIVIVTRW